MPRELHGMKKDKLSFTALNGLFLFVNINSDGLFLLKTCVKT